MATRNTPVLQKILEALDDLLPADIDALARLEEKFKDDLLIIAGDIKTVEIYAEELRLSINHPEAAQVLDYIGTGKQAGVSIDQVEDAINTLFPGRFIEP